MLFMWSIASGMLYPCFGFTLVSTSTDVSFIEVVGTSQDCPRCLPSISLSNCAVVLVPWVWLLRTTADRTMLSSLNVYAYLVHVSHCIQRGILVFIVAMVLVGFGLGQAQVIGGLV